MVRSGDSWRISPHARAWEGTVPMAEDAHVWPAIKVYRTGLMLEFTGEVAAAIGFDSMLKPQVPAA